MPIPVFSAEEQEQQKESSEKSHIHLVTDEVIWSHKPDLMKEKSSAPFPVRVAAHLLDLFVVQGVGLSSAKLWSLVLLSGHMREINRTGKWASDILMDAFNYGGFYMGLGCVFGAAFFYFVLLPFYTGGRTFGLGLMGLKIEADDHGAPSLRNLTVRFFCYAVSYLGFGFAFLLGMRSRQGALLHDEISKTRVVKSAH